MQTCPLNSSAFSAASPPHPHSPEEEKTQTSTEICEVGLAGMATLSPAATLPAAAALGSGVSRSMRRKASVTHVGELSSFGGLKAHNSIASLGLPECVDRSFAMVVAGLRSPSSHGKGKGKGGALSSTCSAAAEIFRIAAIMNGLVLVGVAVGFIILRVEASLEETE